jgi:hypothetical protein
MHPHMYIKFCKLNAFDALWFSLETKKYMWQTGQLREIHARNVVLYTLPFQAPIVFARVNVLPVASPRCVRSCLYRNALVLARCGSLMSANSVTSSKHSTRLSKFVNRVKDKLSRPSSSAEIYHPSPRTFSCESTCVKP